MKTLQMLFLPIFRCVNHPACRTTVRYQGLKIWPMSRSVINIAACIAWMALAWRVNWQEYSGGWCKWNNSFKESFLSFPPGGLLGRPTQFTQRVKPTYRMVDSLRFSKIGVVSISLLKHCTALPMRKICTLLRGVPLRGFPPCRLVSFLR